jgi:hypothetical protein
VLEVTETPNQTKQARREERLERTVIRVQGVLAWIGFLIGTLWAAGAIYYDGPFARDDGDAWLACFLVVLILWIRQEPSNDRRWRAEWARTPARRSWAGCWASSIVASPRA